MSDPNIRGRRGPTGITGQTGQTGQPGQPGVPGVPGDIGETGAQGLPGLQGEVGKSPTGDLLLAVRTLVKEVEELSQRLANDYPSRQEVRHSSRKRTAKALVFGLVLILIANVLTIQTISYCFLTNPGVHPSNCNYIPGYKNAQEVSDTRLARFTLLLEQIVENQKSISDLQRRVDILENPSGRKKNESQ